MLRDVVCWQCGKPATVYLPYWRGGHGWVDLPVCDLKDGHPAFEEMEMAQEDTAVVQTAGVAGATYKPNFITSESGWLFTPKAVR